MRLVERAYDAWNRRDIEAGLTMMSEDVVWQPPPDSPFAGPYVGHDQVRRFFESMLELFDAIHRTPGRMEMLGSHVVVDVHSTVRGAGSGVEVEVAVTDVFTIENGLCTRYAVFPDRAQALAYVARQEGVSAAR